MVLITVDSFLYKGSLAVYELSEGSMILDLKAEIEVTEGIPIGHQRLVRNKRDNQDLQDDENLNSFTIIYLLQARIHCHFKTRNTTDCHSDHQKTRVLTIHIDLNKPVSTLKKHWTYGRTISPELFILDLADKQHTVRISDMDQSFSYYGIRNGDVINIISEPKAPWGDSLSLKDDIISDHDDDIAEYIWRNYSIEGGRFSDVLQLLAEITNSDPHEPIEIISYSLSRSSSPDYSFVQAKHDWNGEMMHPVIKGLSLQRNALFVSKIKDRLLQPGWLYGSPFSQTGIGFPELSYDHAIHAFQRGTKGYIPETFVSPVEGAVRQHSSEATEVLEIPPLPPFEFPLARRMAFHLPISDKGHSFLKLTVNYERTSSPVDPTHVTVSLLCTTHDIRRVSAISVFIIIPKSEVLGVHVHENEAHRTEIHTDKEVTESHSKEKRLDGFNIGTHGTTVGFQGGISAGYSFGSTEKGPKVSRRKVTAGIDKEDSIFWNLKAPTSKLDEDGLDGVESISLILKKKPVEFKYKCRVTHARNGVEKTTERMTRDWPWKLLYTPGWLTLNEVLN